MLKVQSFVFLVVMLIAAIGLADDIRNPQVAQESRKAAEQQRQQTNMMRHEAGLVEFDARLAAYQTGRSAVNTVIQSNQRLLRASLDAGVPNAAVDYNQRAIKIAQFARMQLKNGTGTQSELDQAVQARLDAMLKRLLEAESK